MNNERVAAPAIFGKISSKANGYSGFQFGGLLAKSSDEVVLGEKEYFCLGDNSANSFDSRYWGAVPEKNIIGKVTRIYWPFTRINALGGK